jgi:hypothetical protein
MYLIKKERGEQKKIKNIKKTIDNKKSIVYN